MLYLLMQSTINQAFKNNDKAARSIKPLVGKIVSWHYRSIGLTFIFSSKSIICKPGICKNADALLNYDITSLIRILHALNNNKPVPNSINVKDSDVTLLSSLQQLIAALDINLSTISKTFCQQPYLEDSTNSCIERGKSFLNTNMLATLEYFRDEKHMFVTKDDAIDFFNRIDALQMKIDRIKKSISTA